MKSKIWSLSDPKDDIGKNYPFISFLLTLKPVTFNFFLSLFQHDLWPCITTCSNRNGTPSFVNLLVLCPISAVAYCISKHKTWFCYQEDQPGLKFRWPTGSRYHTHLCFTPILNLLRNIVLKSLDFVLKSRIFVLKSPNIYT